MTHFGYVFAAYSATAVALFGMIAWVVADLAAQRKKLGRLEAEGRRRRSEVSR